MDLVFQLPPTCPNIEACFLSVLLETRGMWLVARRPLKNKRRQSKRPSVGATDVNLTGTIWRCSQVGQDGGPSSLRLEFEPPHRYQIGRHWPRVRLPAAVLGRSRP